jgi:hypothetical protein
LGREGDRCSRVMRLWRDSSSRVWCSESSHRCGCWVSPPATGGGRRALLGVLVWPASTLYYARERPRWCRLPLACGVFAVCLLVLAFVRLGVKFGAEGFSIHD